MTDVVALVERANPVPVDAIRGLDETELRVALDAAMRRNGALRGKRVVRPRSARALGIAFVALTVAVPLALALGLETRLRDVIFGKAVPVPIRRELHRMLEPPIPPREGPPGGLSRKDIIRGSERLVARIRTERGGVASLYVVRLRTGGFCQLAFGRPFDGGGCSRLGRSVPGDPVQGSVGTFAAGRRTPRASVGVGLTFAGRATATHAVAINVIYRDGTSATIRLSHRWFLYEVPTEHTQRGHEPVRFDVVDAHGTVLGREQDPFLLRRPTQAPSRPLPGSVRLVAEAPLGWRHARVLLSVGRDRQGDRCVRALNTEDHVQTIHWLCDPDVGKRALGVPTSRSPVQWNLSRRVWPGQPGYVYAYGWAGPPVASLELRFQDSAVERLSLRDRTFLYVVPPDRFLLGHRPSYLVGRSRAGRVIFRRFLYPRGHCNYPGPDRRCRGIIVWNG